MNTTSPHIQPLASRLSRVVLPLVGVCLVIYFVASHYRTDPYPSFTDQITKGMTIEEVKQILGEPIETERLKKMVKVPIDVPLYDDEGNKIDTDHIVKMIDGGQKLEFRIRRTEISVIFDEDDKVEYVVQSFAIQGKTRRPTPPIR